MTLAVNLWRCFGWRRRQRHRRGDEARGRQLPHAVERSATTPCCRRRCHLAQHDSETADAGGPTPPTPSARWWTTTTAPPLLGRGARLPEKRGLKDDETIWRTNCFANRTLACGPVRRAWTITETELRPRLQTLGVLRASGHGTNGCVVVPIIAADGQVQASTGAGSKSAGRARRSTLPAGLHRGVWNSAVLAGAEVILASVTHHLSAGFRHVTTATASRASPSCTSRR